MGKLQGLGVDQFEHSQLTALNLLTKGKELFLFLVLPTGYGMSFI